MQRNLCKGVAMTNAQYPDSEKRIEEASRESVQGEISDTTRRIDATAMKAFAHPLRMAMYDYLNDHGSATATMLAKHTGESTGQTSYHLRQLERHGFVTDDATRGTGRERWWKPVGFSMHSLELAKDASARPAVASMMRNQVDHHAAALSDWFGRAESEESEWANASTNNRYTLLLTPEEVREMRDRVVASFQDYSDISEQRAAAGSEAEAGTRRIRVYLDLFPLPEDQ